LIPPPFPWPYPFTEDLSAERYPDNPARIVLRPIVLVGFLDLEQKVEALVDSGCEHVLAAPWIARALGLDLEGAFREINLGIGGETRRVRFLDVSIRLYAPPPSDDAYIEWNAEVGFPHEWRPTWQVLLGQVGFYDQFTVTMHRGAQSLIIEDSNEFDERFGLQIREAEKGRARFIP
jgi:hypothetical protein